MAEKSVGKWIKVTVTERHSNAYLVKLTPEEWERYENDSSVDLTNLAVQRGIQLHGEFEYIETEELPYELNLYPENVEEYLQIITDEEEFNAD